MTRKYNRKNTPQKRQRQHTPVMIEGESAPDPHNADVQESAPDKPEGPFTAGEEGAIEDRQGGPVDQEGEGNRQMDETAEYQQPVQDPMDRED
jgi:hypothetical protein